MRGVLLAAALLVGCAPTGVEVSEVLNHHACRTVERGVSEVSASALPDIRGSRLLSLPGEDSPSSASAESERMAPQERLFAVSNGAQPSAGYSMTLQDATMAEDGTLTLDYRWHAAPKEHVQAAIVTHPCSVVSVSGRPVQRIAAKIDGEDLASLAL